MTGHRISTRPLQLQALRVSRTVVGIEVVVQPVAPMSARIAHLVPDGDLEQRNCKGNVKVIWLTLPALKTSPNIFSLGGGFL